MSLTDISDCQDPRYAARLSQLSLAPWKRWFGVQLPYRFHLRSLRLGRTLEIGCGVGRNLDHLGGGAVGVDSNTECVNQAKLRGFAAYTPEVFSKVWEKEKLLFDSILCAHVAEHMSYSEAVQLLHNYLHYLKSGGRVVLITPQEKGFASDPSHCEYFDFPKLRKLASDCNLKVDKHYSFPFPQFVGKYFAHNENVLIGRAS